MSIPVSDLDAVLFLVSTCEELGRENMVELLRVVAGYED